MFASPIVSASLLAAGLICFGIFAWGVKSHFRSTGAMPRGMKVISILTFASFVWFAIRLFVSAPSGLWSVAIAFFLLSIALFAWTVQSSRKNRPTLAYDTDEPSFLLQHGPYHYVRHPFYLSYLLFWTGTAIASRGLAPWAVPVVMLLVYWDAARREEQKFAHSSLAPAYAHYRAQAGMLLPRLRSVPNFQTTYLRK